MATYKYQPLPSAHHIRVVRLEQSIRCTYEEGDPIVCTLETLDIRSADRIEYWTLSYTWGDPRPQNEHDESEESIPYRRSLFNIECDGAVLKVRKNLLHALERSRGFDGPIWIDAICINQEDSDERNAQVAIMGEIYASCQGVIVWMGEDEGSDRRALPLIEKFGEVLEREWWPESGPFTNRPEDIPPFNHERVFQAFNVEPLTIEDWTSILYFLRRAWFHRAWTIQEICLPKLKVVVCGGHVLSWPYLGTFCNFIRQIDWEFPARHTARVPPNESTAFSLLACSRKMWTRWDTPPLVNQQEQVLAKFYGTGDIEHKVAAYSAYVVSLSRSREATDARDKVIAPLSLAAQFGPQPMRLVPLPDYTKSIKDIYVDFAKFVLNGTKRLTLLTQVENLHKTPRNEELPSWVPDFAHEGKDPYSSFTRDVSYDPCDSERVAKFDFSPENHLLVRGYRFADLEQTCPADWGSDEYDVISVIKLVLITSQQWSGPDWLSHLAHAMTASALDPMGASELQDAFYRFLAMAIYASKAACNGRRVEEYCEDLSLLVTRPPHCFDTEPMYKACSAYFKATRGIFGMDDMAAIRRNEEWHEYKKRAKLFFGVYETATDGRNFFALTNGILGLGSERCVAGDQVWFFPGSSVPILLRLSPNGNYKVIGEAYVHGYMQGEAFRSGLLRHGGATMVVLE